MTPEQKQRRELRGISFTINPHGTPIEWAAETKDDGLTWDIFPIKWDCGLYTITLAEYADKPID